MQISNYGIEKIPDTARLYYRVHKNIYMATVRAAEIPPGKLPSGVFRFQGDDLSVDWSKYARPEETKNRATVPEDIGGFCCHAISRVSGEQVVVDIDLSALSLEGIGNRLLP